jgi:hypothetical protein
MGSLFSTPKTPQVRSSVVPINTSQNEVADVLKTDKEISSNIRKENLLRKARGAAGTVLTSFNGFFEEKNEGEVPSKTLLGE